MGRITAAAAIGLFVLAGIMATVGFVRDARMNDAPTASECVDDWNARAGVGSHGLIAENGYRSAAVQGWFHDWAGCGIVFRPRGEHPVLVHTCSRGFSASDPAGTDWACELDTLVWDASFADPSAVAGVTGGGTLTLPA